MPDMITVSGVTFGSGETENALTYQFIPSVTGENYTYRISFTDTTGETFGVDAAYRDGMCAGTVQLPSYDGYTVVVTVSNGLEERAIPVASGLLIHGTHVSWSD